jgi:poly(3-hydroxybutyrate) depolymerase
MPFAMELLAVETGYPAGFLAAMLEGVQSEGNEQCGLRVSVDANDAAFFARLVVIMVKQHSTNPRGLFVRELF